jgi:hypothetical protein
MGQYYADAKNAAAADAIISALEAGDYKTEPSPHRLPASELNPYTAELLRFSVLTAAFCLLITAIFFVARQKHTVSVQKLCGMTRRNLIMAYGARVSAAAAGAFAMIAAATLFLSENFNNSVFSMKAMSWHYYAVTGAVLTGLCVCVTGFIAKLADGVNISDTLKGR